MGCCSATPRNADPVVADMRRRLSLGYIDQKIANKTADREEDRSLLVELSKQTLLDIVKSDTAFGEGRRLSWAINSETDIDRHRRASFSQKTVRELGSDIQNSTTTSTEKIGYACKKGLKPEAPNQDSFFIVKIATSSEDYSIYGVFDGHGPAGHDVSDFVKNELPKVLIKEQGLQTGDIHTALLETFEKTQRLLEQATEMGQISAQFSGTTCSVILHMHEQNAIYVAHVGDSRCVLGRKDSMMCEAGASPPKTQTAKANHLIGKHENGKKKGVNGFLAVDLTQDHKPDDAVERERIETKGGRVVFDGFYNYRVYAKTGRYPGLNMSRAMGDLAGYYDAGISPVPDIQCILLRQQEGDPEECEDGVDKFLLLCSDGVWEFMSSQECINICASYKAHQAQDCAEMLAKESWDRWNMHMMGQVVDDITAVVIFL